MKNYICVYNAYSGIHRFTGSILKHGSSGIAAIIMTGVLTIVTAVVIVIIIIIICVFKKKRKVVAPLPEEPATQTQRRTWRERWNVLKGSIESLRQNVAGICQRALDSIRNAWRRFISWVNNNQVRWL